MSTSHMPRLALGIVAVVLGALFLVFGAASVFDVVRDLVGQPQPAGKDYIVGPLLSILGGWLIWTGLRRLSRGRTTSGAR